MTDILGIANYIQKQGDDGRQVGVNRLLGKAYNAPADQQQAILGQVAANGDPGVAMEAGKGFDEQNVRMHADLAQRAQLVVGLYKAGSPMAEQAYQSMIPIAQRLGYPIDASHGQLTPDMLPGLQKLASALTPAKSAPGSYQEYQLAQQDPNYGKFLQGQQPTQLASIDYTDPGTGQTGKLQVQWNPRTHAMTDMAGNPLNQDGTPQGGAQGAAQAAPQGAPSMQGPAPQVDMQELPGANVPATDEAAMFAAAQNPGAVMYPQANGGTHGVQVASSGAPAPRLGFKADKVEPGVIGKRMQELQDLRGAGQQFSETDASAYLRDGKFPDSNATAPGDPTKTGEEYLATLPPAMRNVVKAIAAGDHAAPSSSSRSPEAQALLQAVYAYDPTANDTNLPARTQTRKDFTSGKSAQNLRSLNQAIGHLGLLESQISGTAGHSIPLIGQTVNEMENAYNRRSGDPGITNYEQTASALASEMTQVFRGNGGAEADLQRNLDQLSSAQSTEQKKAAVKNVVGLLRSRIEELGQQYSQGMGKTTDPYSLINPHAAEVLDRINGTGAAPQPGARAPAPGSIEDGHRFKGGNPADPKNWEAVN